MTRPLATYSTLVLALLLMCVALLPLLDRPGVEADEGRALWIIRDNVRDRGDTVAALRTNLETMLKRLPEQDHPPLYALLLDAWVFVVGAESLLLVRYLSLLGALAAVSALMALLGRLAPVPMALIAPFALGFIAFSAAPLALFAALSALAVLSLRRVLRRATWWRMLLHTIILTALIYSHAFGFVMVLVYFAIVGTKGRSNPRVQVCAGIAVLLYIPWILFNQQAAPFAGEFQVAFLLTPLYVAFIPLVVGFWHLLKRPMRMGGIIIGAICLLLSLWTVWNRPDWTGLIADIHSGRDLTQPILLAYSPQHPLAYYDQFEESRLREGITLDIGWRDFSAAELHDLLSGLDEISTLWLVSLDDQLELIRAAADVRPENEQIRVTGDVIVTRFWRE